jgi:hypothetical protein
MTNQRDFAMATKKVHASARATWRHTLEFFTKRIDAARAAGDPELEAVLLNLCNDLAGHVVAAIKRDLSFKADHRGANVP